MIGIQHETIETPATMRLVRMLGMPRDLKREHDGPEPGGRFFGLEGVHDLPRVHLTVNLADVLAVGCEIWVGNAMEPGTWEPVRSVADVEGRFRHAAWQVEMEVGDGWYDTVWESEFRPWPPEFYVRPFNYQIRKALRILERRRSSRRYEFSKLVPKPIDKM